MSDLFGNHIVGFPTRWLIYLNGGHQNNGQCLIAGLSFTKDNDRAISVLIGDYC